MITVYRHDSKEYDALVAVARILNTLCTNGFRFYVNDVYYDYGAGMTWTTIIAENKEYDYQLLTPRDHALITENICWTRMSQAVNNIIAESKKYELAMFT